MGSGAGGIYSNTYGQQQSSNSIVESSASQHVQAANHGRLEASGGETRASLSKQKADSPLARNAEHMREDFNLGDDGYFAREGSKLHNRVFESDDPLEDSRSFFERISAGGEDLVEPKVDALRRLSDGTRINYRQVTKTPNSPAVQISRSKTDIVKNQKVHFVNGDRQ